MSHKPNLAGAGLFIALLILLTACSSTPKPADWQLESRSALERAVQAYLEGNSRVEAAEFKKAVLEISSTGRPDLLARAELLRCASHVASLVIQPCEGFEKLRQDAAAPELAYADYLAARLQPKDVALLPEQQRAAAVAPSAQTLQAMTEPLSRLVAAGVAFQAGRASPELLQIAVDTASSQGWRRPLLAWLGVQLALAEKAGDSAQAARLMRRITLAQGSSK